MPTPGLLVTTDWLQSYLNDPTVRVVDIRGHVIAASEPPPHYFNHHADYLTAHIPGAVFVDWVHKITDPADPRHAQIAPPERFAALMGALGIAEGITVIPYDDYGGIFAARLWWALNYYGHTAVAVLDGGWPLWLAEGRPTSADLPQPAPAEFTPRIQPEWRRTANDVQGALGQAQILIDVRTPDEFAGRSSRAKRGGHIPTAHNIPRASLIAADGTMPNADNLCKRFAIAEGDSEVVFYCNAGVSASYGLLAWRAAGYAGGSVYDGSWKDWGNDDSKPIER